MKIRHSLGVKTNTTTGGWSTPVKRVSSPTRPLTSRLHGNPRKNSTVAIAIATATAYKSLQYCTIPPVHLPVPSAYRWLLQNGRPQVGVKRSVVPCTDVIPHPPANASVAGCSSRIGGCGFRNAPGGVFVQGVVNIPESKRQERRKECDETSPGVLTLSGCVFAYKRHIGACVRFMFFWLGKRTIR